jgi:hypothetical protein
MFYVMQQSLMYQFQKLCGKSYMDRESIFRLGYFLGFFLFVVIVLTIALCCTFRELVYFLFISFLRVD